MTTLRSLPAGQEGHYVTCELPPWKCGECRYIEGTLT